MNGEEVEDGEKGVVYADRRRRKVTTTRKISDLDYVYYVWRHYSVRENLFCFAIRFGL